MVAGRSCLRREKYRSRKASCPGLFLVISRFGLAAQWRPRANGRSSGWTYVYADVLGDSNWEAEERGLDGDEEEDEKQEEEEWEPGREGNDERQEEGMEEDDDDNDDDEEEEEKEEE